MSPACRPAAATTTGRPAAPVPTRHAWAVQTLLDGGATLIGKTITDEVSLGILGENAFDGTPVNVRAPGRVPGGSSSGSAAAVAAGLCDTALGTDTGGSVRVPASFCGLYGIRPTHGRLDVTGMLPQAPSSDTTGWFARDAATFARVSSVMLGEAIRETLPTRLVIAVDAFGFADARVAAALQPMVGRLAAPCRLQPRGDDGAAGPVGLGAGAAHPAAGRGLAARSASGWTSAIRASPSRSRAAWCMASMVPEAERVWADLMRQEARGRMAYLVPPGTILCLPTTPFPAPLRGQPLSVLDPLRDRITCLCAQGGLAGHPQVSLPGATVDGLPVGLSIIGPRGSDAMLVAVAKAMEEAAT